MAVTETYTIRDICTDALHDAGAVDQDDPPTAEEIERARKHLSRMLKAWQNKGHNLWTVSTMSETATTNAQYTLDPIRPHSIVSVRFKRGNLETPMIEMTRDEYDSLPLKTATGIPTQWHYDRQREAARLYVWPVLAATNSETLEITYHREIEDLVLSDEIDVPAEWYDAVISNLAVRMATTFRLPVTSDMQQQAVTTLWDALGDDREASVFFGEAE